MTRRSKSDPFKIRGLMLDPARLTERHEFYFKILPLLAEWGYNTLWWHFSDDEGFALKLHSHPELASPYAFTKTEMRRLICAAAEVGIDVVPEVETLGHTFAITGLLQYAHLFNGNPYGHNAICPSHPDTIKLMGEIIAEVADLFVSPYLHAGLDEAEIGDCPRCRRAARGKPSWGLFARHAKAIHEIVTRHGKRMIMWADPVEKHPELLKELPRDIIQAHWHYGTVPAEKITPSVDAGFEIVCVPAISQPAAAALTNVDDMVALADQLPATDCLGVVACWWEPFRNLRDMYPFATAYAGRAITSRKRVDRNVFTRRFLSNYFGLHDGAAARAFYDTYKLKCELGYPHNYPLKILFPHTAADIHESLKRVSDNTFSVMPFVSHGEKTAWQCVKALQSAARRVQNHRDEYRASILTARVTATAFSNARLLTEAYREYEAAGAYADVKARGETIKRLTRSLDALEHLLRQVSSLTQDVAREWDRTRYSGDGKKDNSSPRMGIRGTRAILPILIQCNRFMKQFVRSFRQVIETYCRGGPFPFGA